jgi:hypothetical protein
MGGLPRLILIAAALGLAVWFLLRLSPDRPTTVSAPGSAGSEAAQEPDRHEPWTREDRAIWRETVDRRLGR